MSTTEEGFLALELVASTVHTDAQGNLHRVEIRRDDKTGRCLRRISPMAAKASKYLPGANDR